MIVGAEPDWSNAAICRNCGAPLITPFCGACGQKAAARLTMRDLLKDGWERLRFFEFRVAATLGKLAVGPGYVPRGYVAGKRAAYTNPLTLLIAIVALLVLTLAASDYFARFAFAGRDAQVDLMAKRVMVWANWSFSLGIIAVFVASRTMFSNRGYNAIEHAVLAAYVQCLILTAAIINLLPTLAWRDPAFVVWHKQVSATYMMAVKIVIVAVALRQFFDLSWRRDWLRLLAACLIFAATSWLLLRLYAYAILWLISRTS